MKQDKHDLRRAQERRDRFEHYRRRVKRELMDLEKRYREAQGESQEREAD